MQLNLSVILISLMISLPSSVHAQTITMPMKVTADVGEPTQVKVTWSGADFKYLKPIGLNIIREYDPDPQVVSLQVWSKTPGIYPISCIASSKEGKLCDFQTCAVTVGNPAPPVPPNPVPPNPVPPNPDPVDSLTQELQRLYNADTGPNEQKRQVKAQLTALYYYGASLTEDKSLLTVGMLASKLNDEAKVKVGEGLPELGKYLGMQAVTVLGKDGTAEFTDDRRKQAKQLFTRIARSLESVK